MKKKTVILASIAVLVIGFIWVYNSKNTEEEIAATPMSMPELPPPPEPPAAIPEPPVAENPAPLEPPPPPVAEAPATPPADEVNKMAGLGASSSGRSR